VGGLQREGRRRRGKRFRSTPGRFDTRDGVEFHNPDIDFIHWLKAQDAMRFNCEFDSNEMDESGSHHGKHDEKRLSQQQGISICDNVESVFANNSPQFNQTSEQTLDGITID
jgi:hypothetical protein